MQLAGERHSDSPLRSLTRGQYGRTTWRLYPGLIGRERVHYKAPPPDQVPDEMAKFLDWLTAAVPLRVITPYRGRCAGVAHAWFGNDPSLRRWEWPRGRAIAEHALSQDLGFPALGGLSSAIAEHRKDYYAELQTVSQGGIWI